MRYHFQGHFVEEQRKGFAVHHQSDKHVETFSELLDVQANFLSSYNVSYCYGLSIGIAEEPTLVDV